MERKTIMVVGAHMCDCEIGAGGTIFRAVKNGHRVILVNVVGDYSTWRVTKGREKDIRERLLAKAREMGVEKRFLKYGYQHVTDDLEAKRRMAEVVVDVKPDVVLMHDRDEREHAPSDHGTVGVIAEHAVRNADTLLGGISVSYGREMYSYEVDPQRRFCPDVFVDVSTVLKPVTECMNFFATIYAESPHAKGANKVCSRMKIEETGEELVMGHWAELRLCLARVRGSQCGLRFAEAFRALDPAPLGRRVLQRIVE